MTGAPRRLVCEVELLKVIALLAAAVAPNRRDVEHTLAELDEGATLHGDVQVCKISQDPVDQFFEPFLAKVVLEGRLPYDGAVLVCEQPILSEAPVKKHWRLAKLLLLLDQVRASHDTDGDLLTQCLQKGERLGRNYLAWLGQRAVDIEERKNARVLARHDIARRRGG